MIVKSQIALLRGINVGGKNVLPIKELVGIFRAMGCDKIQTYIQSGNVVFTSDEKWGVQEAEGIRKAVFDAKGFSPHVLILDKAAWRAAIGNNPFPTTDGKALHGFFLDSKPERPDLERLVELRKETERFTLAGNVFYLFAPEGVGRSKLAAAAEASLGVPATARNWNTVMKLAAMLEDI